MNNFTEHCPLAYSMEILGGKWTFPLIWLINSYPRIRYGQMKKVFPVITNTALTRTLQMLEKNEIIIRTDYNETPPRVEYSLTERGESLMPIIDSLGNFGDILMKESGKKPYWPNAQKILNRGGLK